ncbi:flavin reductase family protein [Salibacterium sp. K-3]
MSDKNVRLIDPGKLETREMYKLLIGAVVPRPIAWISTQDKHGTRNLAPFSFFTVASPSPPTLAVSIATPPAPKERKDTLANIRNIGEYVVNVVPESLGKNMQISSEPFAEGEDEFQKASLTPYPSNLILPPRVEESPISFELQLDQILEIGTNALVLGTVVQVHVEESVYLDSYKTDIEKWKPLARLAGDYASISSPYPIFSNESE